MKKITAILIVSLSLPWSSFCQQQGGNGFFSFGGGTGVPTDTAMGSLLGMLIAPMISKGSDAKLVGALLGGMGANAVSTARYNQQQQQQFYQQSQAQPRRVNYANYNPQGNSVYPTSGEYMPEGMINRNGMIQSPFSQFSVDPKSNGIYHGQVIYDPFTGAPFRVP
jgi:hypothetical protein